MYFLQRMESRGVGEAFRPRSRDFPKAFGTSEGLVQRRRDLPNRPLPGKRARPEPNHAKVSELEGKKFIPLVRENMSYAGRGQKN